MEYLVVIEINRIGIIIGEYKSFKKAQNINKRIWEIVVNYPYDEIKAEERVKNDFLYGRRSYNIRAEIFIKKLNNHKRMCKQTCSNGMLETYIFYYRKDVYGIDSFIKEREFQTELFID